MNEIVKVFDFEGEPLTAVTYKGCPAVIAKEIGERLGYAENGKRLVKSITGRWASSFENGKHYVMLTGSELRDFKRLLSQGTQMVPSQTHHLMLLFEIGVNKVAIKSHKPVAERLHDFLAEDVMPQLARDGRYLPERFVNEQGQITTHDEELQVLNARMLVFDAERRRDEIRLKLEKVNISKTREARLGRQTRSKGLRIQANQKFKLGHIDRKQRDTLLLFSAEALLGDCEFGDWVSYSDLSAELGVSAASVGQMVNEVARSMEMSGDELRSNTQYFKSSKMNGRVADFVRGIAAAEKKKRRGRKGKGHPDQIPLRSVH